MRIIYEPRGRAKEYAPYAASLYRGCPHGCLYCYVPESTRTEQTAFLKPYYRKDALFLLEQDLKVLAAAGDQQEVLLSFTTDPYQPLDQKLQVTRKGLQHFIKYGIHVTVLTKGGLRSTRDFDLMAEHPDLCRYGTTLTLCNPASEKEWEPHAATWTERVEALRQAHSLGIGTWASCEPLIDPMQTRYLIAQTLADDSVDEYRIGALNHREATVPAAEITEFVRSTDFVLRSHGKRFIFKKDLQPYLQAAGVHGA